MWTNISSLAQKAKEAAAIFEEQINDSIGLNKDGASPSPKANAAAVDGGRSDGGDDEAADGVERVGGSDGGWEKCGDNSSDDDGDDKPLKLKDGKSQEMSYVDLKSAAEDVPKRDDSGGMEANTALSDALARIESLEKQALSLKNELAAAREESQNYHATNLLLEQQVKELQEENRSLKESGADEK